MKAARGFAGQPQPKDETFHFFTLSFNVRLAADILKASPRDLEWLESTKADCGLVVVDEVYALEKADCNIPVIVGTLPIGPLMIDGYHRAFRAVKQGRELIPMYRLTLEETRACCFTPQSWRLLEKNARRKVL